MADGIVEATEKKLPAPDSQNLFGLLPTVGGWDGFDVTGVTTEDAPAPDAPGDPGLW